MPPTVPLENSNDAVSQGPTSGSDDRKRQPHLNSIERRGKAAAPIISCISCRKRKLKCDKNTPRCRICMKQGRDCQYPERKSNLDLKQQKIDELQARLAQLEGLLASQPKEAELGKAIPGQRVPTSNDEPIWNTLEADMLNGEFVDINFEIPQVDTGFQSWDVLGNFVPHDLIALGMQEPLPPQAMIDELYEVYFDKVHPTMPMIHKYRYYASLKLGPHMRPPVCLQYAMWAAAAALSDKYTYYQDVLYERAKRYINEAEAKSHGETFVTLRYAQAWGLISSLESKKMYSSRAWMSVGRMTRLTFMLGLHRLNAEASKHETMSSGEWIELEERRRTFWVCFYGDRWSSFASNLPMAIQEDQILTNLPASEESFENGSVERTILLGEAMTPEGAANVTSFGGVILSVCLFGHHFQHLHKTGQDEHPDDYIKGEFWIRHRKMTNMLSKISMFLPDHLKLPRGFRDMKVVIINMNIHAADICLQEIAIKTAKQYQLDLAIVRQSRAQCLVAAEEIVGIMRLISHLDLLSINPCMVSCLYIAARVFIEYTKSDESRIISVSNLEFIVNVMLALGKRHSIVRHFAAQLEFDIEAAGIEKSMNFPQQSKMTASTTLVHGLLAHQKGEQLVVEEGNSLASKEYIQQTSLTNENSIPSGDMLPPDLLPTMTKNAFGVNDSCSMSTLTNWDLVQDVGGNVNLLVSNEVPFVDFNYHFWH